MKRQSKVGIFGQSVGLYAPGGGNSFFSQRAYRAGHDSDAVKQIIGAAVEIEPRDIF